jgi:UDP-GlcNAc3NAcA epimerase
VKTILTVVGARPQFVKAAPLSRRLRRDFREVLVHTGQHYDRNMSEAFFLELAIPKPDVNLGVGSKGHARQTRDMTAGILEVLADAVPDLVLTYGDTNSTLAASLAALKTGCRIAHVEAGLRSFNLMMPEEVNRIAADHVSDLCLCPTETAVGNLKAEGIEARAVLVGDVMLDGCLEAKKRAGPEILKRLGLTEGGYFFATVHRAENTDHRTRLLSILDAFRRLPVPVVFPIHPRTRKILAQLDVTEMVNVLAIEPTTYLETISLLSRSRLALTDSGGLQKEACFLGVPCVTLRDETEWTETIESGWNHLAGADTETIVSLATSGRPAAAAPDLSGYGGGHACDRIAKAIARLLSD